MAITGMGSIRQEQLPRGKLFGLGCGRCRRFSGRFEADIKWQASSAGSVANDPTATSATLP